MAAALVILLLTNLKPTLRQTIINHSNTLQLLKS